MKIMFSERLRDLRAERGLSQSELGKALGTTQRRVSYWESGKIEPDLASLCKLAVYFGISADYLLGLKDY